MNSQKKRENILKNSTNEADLKTSNKQTTREFTSQYLHIYIQYLQKIPNEEIAKNFNITVTEVKKICKKCYWIIYQDYQYLSDYPAEMEIIKYLKNQKKKRTKDINEDFHTNHMTVKELSEKYHISINGVYYHLREYNAMMNNY